jgi:general secretion pathway protein G
MCVGVCRHVNVRVCDARDPADGCRVIRTRAAFSLIELVIVIVIIGVIAAIAVPRMSSGAVSSKVATTASNLNALRRAVDMFTAEHEGRTPNYNDAMERTDSGDEITKRLTLGPGNDGVRGGPYLIAIPINPFTSTSDIVMSKNFTSPSSAGAWSYDFMTDEVWNDQPVDPALWSIPSAKVILSPEELVSYTALK